jgi:hypothetical protein
MSKLDIYVYEINRHLNISAMEDRQAVMMLRPSPEINHMHRITDKDGTVWAFTNKTKMQEFKHNRRETKAKKHFLSDREILSGWLHNEIK